MTQTFVGVRLDWSQQIQHRSGSHEGQNDNIDEQDERAWNPKPDRDLREKN